MQSTEIFAYLLYLAIIQEALHKLYQLPSDQYDVYFSY